MFAIAYDMEVEAIRKAYGKHPRSAYLEIETTLKRFGFERIQDSVFAAQNEDLSELFQAIEALKVLPWFGSGVKSLRAFRMEQGSDFTGVVQGTAPIS